VSPRHQHSKSFSGSGQTLSKLARWLRIERAVSAVGRIAITCASLRQESASTRGREFASEVGPFGIERPKRALQVGEERPVLDVEQRLQRPGPCNDVRAAGKLEVLVRLVERGLETEPAQMGRLRLAHRRMYLVCGTELGRLAPARIDELKQRAQPQRACHPAVRLE
jgi:hypothetical protein